MGEGLTQKNEIEGRWKEYFVQLLNGDEIREVGDVRGGSCIYKSSKCLWAEGVSKSTISLFTPDFFLKL